MDCETCREALSARLDGEPEPAAPDEHLRSCPACQEWQKAATTLKKATRAADTPPPDVTTAVLTELEPRTGLLGTTRWRPRGSR